MKAAQGSSRRRRSLEVAGGVRWRHGREVEVPYSVHYDITGDGISALRIYALEQGLVSALTA